MGLGVDVLGWRVGAGADLVYDARRLMVLVCERMVKGLIECGVPV